MRGKSEKGQKLKRSHAIYREVYEEVWECIQPEKEERWRRRWCRPPVNPEPLQMLLCPPPLELWIHKHTYYSSFNITVYLME